MKPLMLLFAGLLCSVSMDCSGRQWQTFVSQGGWSVDYPKGWKVGSCHVCTDPTEPGIFVNFEGTGTTKFLMVEPLADKPANQTYKGWLDSLKHTANQNALISETWTTVDKRPALQVTYRYANGVEEDTVYAVDGVKTYGIGPINRQSDTYPTFKHMVKTFRFTSGY